MSESAQDPVAIRKRVLALRRAQKPAERAAKSARLIQRWKDLLPRDTRIPARKIALFRSMGDEVDLSELGKSLIAAKAEVYFPRIRSRQSPVLDLVRVTAATAWMPGPFGIEEPVDGDVLADPAKLDVVFVPGVVFGPKGERIGMGAGYYDRLLAQNDRALRVSLAFDFQCEDNIPQQSWDQYVDWVLTEIRDFRGPKWAQKMDLLKK